MSNAKRFLSVILAIIMVCSTLVIGANAAYTAYKDAAIAGQYNELDQAVLTTDQYASAAMDEVDRMLDEEQLMFTRDDIVVGDIDLTSLDAAMDSIYAIVHGTLFETLKGMLGDLKNLNVDAFAPESAGGVRRTTAGKTDTDIIYAVLQFLNDNKGILTGFVAGTLDLGSIVASLVDISEFADVNVLLKGLLYEATYVDENGDSLDKPEDTAEIRALSIDTMVQDLIDRYVVDEFEIDDVMVGSCFEGHTNISTGTMYNFIDQALKDAYNGILVPLVLNGSAQRGIGEACGVEYTKDELTGEYTADESNLNAYAQYLNYDNVVPTYSFTSATFVSQLNNVVKSIADVLFKPEVFVWQAGANTMFKQNVINLAKAILINTGDDFFANYIEVATADEVEDMTDQELVSYVLRAIINGSVDEMYIPEEATTIREFGYYTLKQLLATSVPALDFSSLDPNSTDSLIVMGIDYAIYSIDAELDMGLEYVYDMDGVDDQLATAAQYAIDNYGGLLSGIDFTGCDSGWELIDTILFNIIDESWLPSAACGTFQNFLINGLVDNILDLDFEGLFALFNYRTGSELQSTPKQVVINRVRSILNAIIPGAIQPATTLDAIATNNALSGTVGALIDTLWGERVDLVKSILPTLCGILDLTNEQEFEFPKLTYDKMVYASNGLFDFNVKIRNNSTGINTGYTDKNGVFHQDELYTYAIRSITGNVSGITVTGPTEIAGGVTENIRVNGSISNTESTLKVVILYDVLTEDGSNLTSTPIEEDVYIVLTKNSPIDETTFSTTAAGGFKIKKGFTNTFAKSVGYITDIELTIENTNSADVTYTAYSDFGTTAAKGQALAQWVELIPDSNTVMQAYNGNNGVGKFDVFQATETYKALTGTERSEAWAAFVEANKTTNARTGAVTYPSYTIALGATSGSTTTKTTAAKIFLYNDFGLEGLVNSELNKHRQASAYSDATAWANYQASLLAAVNAVYSPFTSTFATGKAANYEKAANGDGTTLGLAEAIVALEETAAGAGVESLQAIIDQYNPDNGELEYDDPDYNYFGVSDYEAYTYYNYRDEYKSASRMIDRATIPDEETGEVAVISELDKAYMEHRLSLYGSRLLPTTTTKQHLAAELANLTRTSIVVGDQGEWSDESWENFERAYAFATSVNATTGTLKQSKVNRALDELLEAEKRLVVATDEPGGDEEVFEVIDPSEMSEEGCLFEFEGDETIILSGITPNDFDPEAYFNCTNCSVNFTENESGMFSTGAVVEIIGDISGEVLATYTISVYTDVDGDGDISMGDYIPSQSYVAGSIDLMDYERIAADLDGDEDVSNGDLVPLLSAISGSVDFDYVNRTFG